MKTSRASIKNTLPEDGLTEGDETTEEATEETAE